MADFTTTEGEDGLVSVHDESPSPLSVADIEHLSAGVVGPVSSPGSAQYARECRTFNLATPVRPAVAVGVTSVADVQASVRFAVERGLPVAIVSTGHQVACTGEGAVLVNTSRLSAVHVDAERHVARVEGGTLASRVAHAAGRYGLAPIIGASSTVGIVGFSLGGGHSPVLGRRYGYGADHIQAIEIVTADGQARTATASAEPDLFWALRGGKGNFGVVTAMELALFPVARFYGGGLFFSGEHAAEVLHVWRQWVAGLPVEATSSIAFLRRAPKPFTVHVRFSTLGSEQDADRLLAPMRALTPTVIDTMCETPYPEAAKVYMDPTEPAPVTENSTSLREFPRGAADALLRNLGPGSGTHLDFMELQALGGALGKPPAVPNAVAGRSAHWALTAKGTGTPEQNPALQDELAALAVSLAPWSQDETHVNLLPGRAMSPREVRAVYGPERYDRLAAIKQRYDPANVFRVNHNIVP